MYGFVNSALEKLIKRRFGVEKWDEIMTHAEVELGDDSDSFQINHVYKDEDTYSLVAAASEVLGLDPSTILEMFGEQFLLWCQESGYAKTLQLLGRSLQDFLTNLDALHDHLSIIYPQMDAPSFRCTEGLKTSEFLLHYYSDRVGLENIVMGIVKSVSREYYNTEVEMKLIVTKGQDRGADHSIFSIREVAYHRQSISNGDAATGSNGDKFSDEQLVTSKTFCRAFPFHIIFGSDMQILQLGSSLSWVLPNLTNVEKCLTHYFALERPRMKLSFDNILSHINTIFILRLLDSNLSDEPPLDMTNHFSFGGNDPMRLRGQMIYLPEVESMLFLCSPRVKRLHDLEQRGLYLSDIPIHDATRGLLMMGQAAESEFANSIRLEELVMELQAVQRSLEDEKRRMSDLLHEMLPISVADRLMAGQSVEAERYESVTILFSDIVGFTSICSHTPPMQIVNMLNRLYSMFDQVVGHNRVYKVETIGDAYMVVGGLPERNTTHAECVANQALDMMHYCTRVPRPDNNEPILMRIGIHSGAVVAGIVGRRMPRFCLFGNTVNIASRTESNGVPGKIQVTEFTYNLLKSNPNFVFEFRDKVEFKNVPKPIPCYFLLENNSKEEFTPVVVADEPTQGFEFIVSRPPTPPSTPFHSTLNCFSPTDLTNRLSSSTPTFDLPPSPMTPGITVLQATPSPSPDRTPPQSQKSSVQDLLMQELPLHWPLQCPFRILQSPTPPPGSSDSENEASLQNSPIAQSTPDFKFPRRPNDLDLVKEPAPDYPEKIRMSPLKEEETPDPISASYTSCPVTQGLDKLAAEKKDHSSNPDQPPDGVGLRLNEEIRKISDASSQSVESARTASNASKLDSSESEDTGKLSTKLDRERKTSLPDEDLDYLRSRSGSVNERVEYYNSLSRRRRRGICTMTAAYAKFHIVSEDKGEKNAPPTTNTGPVIVNGRSERKSLDSLGSSGSND